MYSRNQMNGRGRKNISGESRSASYTERNEEYRTMSDEEYELYRYNIPPRYDGSRFRAGNMHESLNDREDSDFFSEEHAADAVDTDSTDDSDCEDSAEETALCNTETAPSCKSDENEEKGELIRGLMSKLHDRFGSEELLITALILIIADGENSGDVLLFLALLLAVR